MKPQVIGRPGVSDNKIEIPEGFQLWKFARSGSLGTSNLVGYDGGSGSIIFEFKPASTGNYSANDIQVWLIRNTGTEASTNWSAPGSSPRLSARYFAGSQWSTSLDITNEDPYIESPDCDLSNQNRAHAEISGVYYTRYTNTGINPLLQVRNAFLDAPGSRQNCFTYFRITALVLFNASKIVSINENDAFRVL